MSLLAHEDKRRVALLLRVISRVGKKLGVDAPLNPVDTFDNNAIVVGVNEVVIQDFIPNGLH
jgi:hypothetical protein